MLTGFRRVHKVTKSHNCPRQVCLSVCMEHLGSYRTDLREILHFELSLKCRENLSLVKIGKNITHSTYKSIISIIGQRNETI